MEQQVQLRHGKSNLPILVPGIIGLVGVAFLTFFATKAVVEKINQNADSAYINARNRYLQQQAAISQPVEEPKKTSVQVTGYSSEDLVEVDGEWYLIADLAVEGSDVAGTLPPITVDTEDFIFVDGSKYMHILNPETLADANSSREFFGNEYIVVDIDGTMVYLVSKGDTLSKVSGRIGYSVQELAEFNQIDNVNLIYEGQTLRVPASDEILDYVKNHQDEYPSVQSKSSAGKADQAETKKDTTDDKSAEEIKSSESSESVDAETQEVKESAKDVTSDTKKEDKSPDADDKAETSSKSEKTSEKSDDTTSSSKNLSIGIKN